MTRRLFDSVSQLKNSTKKVRLFGRLGIPLNGARTVEVVGRGGFVYVRLRENTSEVIQAFNEKVSPIYDMPVEIERQGNLYYVIGRDVEQYSNWGNFTPFFPKHGDTHSFDPYLGSGGDVVWVWGRQFAPMLLVPSGTGGPNLYLMDYTMLDPNGNWISVGMTGTPDVVGYKPTGQDAVMGIVAVNRINGGIQLIINSGTHAPVFATGTSDIVPYLPSITNPYLIPAGAFRLTSGTSTLYWENLYDVRQHFGGLSTTGSGGGLSSIAVQDEGVAQGNATTFNFVGNGVDVSVSGSIARVHVSGSNITNNTYNNTAIAVQDDGVFVASGTVLSFDSNLNVSLVGTDIHVFAPITTYFRVGQTTTLSSPTGLFWIVPDRVYASGSLGIFNNGHALIPGIDYIEQLWVSGTYQYMTAQPTGTFHLAHYGVPCSPQVQPPTGTTDQFWLTDSDDVYLTDSDDVQLLDSNG